MDLEGISLEKVPPQNLEAERSVLGAMLIEREAIPKVIETLVIGDFYREAHRKIYETMITLFEKNEAVDLVTLSEALKKVNSLEEVGGAAYLAALINNVPTAANVEYYCRIVKEKAILRNLITAATQVAAQSYEGSEDIDTLLDNAERLIFNVSQNRIREGFTPLKAILKDSFEAIEKLYNKKERVTGIPTGFRDFDSLTSGLHPSDLIVIAGRPAMGKSSFCLNVAQHVGIDVKVPVAVFSLEMSKEQVVQRMLCSEARVDAHKLRTGYLSDADWPKLTIAAGRLSEAPIFIDDTPAISVLECRAKARRLKAEYGLSLIIIDYLQLMQAKGRAENRQQEISEISRSLKALAKELKVPVVALSQLSRRVEDREEKRPQLSDLRESGAIEQDADLVAFIYRPEYYRETEENKGIAEVIIGKQRHGPVGVVKLTFLKEYTRFENMAYRRE